MSGIRWPRAALLLACAGWGAPRRRGQVAAAALAHDPFNLLVRALSDLPREQFYGEMHSSPAQSVLDLVSDLDAMGQRDHILALLEGLLRHRPEEGCAMILFTLAYYRGLTAATAQNCCGAPSAHRWGRPILSAPSKRVPCAQPWSGARRRAPFLLGCLLYDKRHYQQAAELFEEALRPGPRQLQALAAAWPWPASATSAAAGTPCLSCTGPCPCTPARSCSTRRRC